MNDTEALPTEKIKKIHHIEKRRSPRKTLVNRTKAYRIFESKLNK